MDLELDLEFDLDGLELLPEEVGLTGGCNVSYTETCDHPIAATCLLGAMF